MVFFNYASMEMSAKIVYYGPGLCGKTTNLKWIFNQIPKDRRGDIVSLATETDRTLFFDLLPLKLGKVGDFTTRIQLYTVPGQVFYNSTRKLVLKGVDGIVFVADSQEPMLDANIESLENLQENLAEQKLNLRKIPWVIQYNKRDLPGIMPVSVLNRHLNFMDVPWYESVATSGQGVMDSLLGIARLTLRHLRKKAGEEVPEDSEELLAFEQELSSALGGSEQAKPPAEKPAAPPPPTPTPPPKPKEKPVPEMTVPVAAAPKPAIEETRIPEPAPAAPVKPAIKPTISVQVQPHGTEPLAELPGPMEEEDVEGVGIISGRDITHRVRIPIKILKDDDLSNINLNLKIEIECMLVSEATKKSSSTAEKLAARALEEFLLGKSKKKKP